MERITANLSGRVRRATLHGREYLVAPITLIVPGVLNGSQGPLYYPSDEVAKRPSAWNSIPIMLDHPNRTGELISARSPDVFDKQWLGTLFNSEVRDGKLVAEAWFDEAATQRIDAGVLSALNQNRPIEISTGLQFRSEPAAEGATYNGTAYTYVVRDFRPDHLAVLLDQTGACSVADGCGVLANENKLSLWRRLGELLGVNVTQNLQNENRSQTMNDTERKAIVDKLIANVCCWEEEDRLVLNKMSDERLAKLSKQGADLEQEQLVANEVRKPWKDEGGDEHTWNEKKKQWETKPKEKEKLAANENKGDEKSTADEWLEAAPPEIRSAVQNARDIENRERAELVKQLMEKTPEDKREVVANRLKDKPLDELRDLLLLSPRPETQPAANYMGAAAPSEASAPKLTFVGLPGEYMKLEAAK